MTTETIPIEHVIAQYRLEGDGGLEADAEFLRREVQNRFPLSAWPGMPLERYALGQDQQDTFCTWLEFRTAALGSILGGSALKLLIYKRRHSPEAAANY